MDTGSSLTWTQCFPCSDCYAQKIYPKYRPAASITYRDAMCEDSHPKSNPHFAFDPLTRICTYQQHYLDETNIKGTLAQEMITVDTHDGGFKRVHGVYFGCNTLSDGSYFTGTGILGLGVGKYSIIGEFGSNFSFCLGEISEPKASHNLIPGEVQTYKDIRRRPLSYEPTLCYKADTIERLEKMDVGFKFDGGAELSVNIHNIFIQQGPPEIRCLAIQNNKESFSHVIIGVIAMQGYNVGYDLSAKTAYINKQDCDM
ncbi:UND [Arabidopsis thaliana]|uniref:UND n=1 Tax=Arabidopsis thaliana TaxID=3702 RepID=A0A178V142_ARATH|nr:UND [Arabidopsis thaliana]